MSDFKERYGHLTVGQALALNEAAKWYCGHDVVANCGGSDE